MLCCCHGVCVISQVAEQGYLHIDAGNDLLFALSEGGLVALGDLKVLKHWRLQLLGYTPRLLGNPVIFELAPVTPRPLCPRNNLVSPRRTRPFLSQCMAAPQTSCPCTQSAMEIVLKDGRRMQGRNKVQSHNTRLLVHKWSLYTHEP